MLSFAPAIFISSFNFGFCPFLLSRSAAEGLVGPDAGDDELNGLSIADFMTDNMASLLKRWVSFAARFWQMV